MKVEYQTNLKYLDENIFKKFKRRAIRLFETDMLFFNVKRCYLEERFYTNEKDKIIFFVVELEFRKNLKDIQIPKNYNEKISFRDDYFMVCYDNLIPLSLFDRFHRFKNYKFLKNTTDKFY